jgi:hypothetical protein
MGAYSFQAGNGYHDLVGGSLSQWPPGYSFILSLFSSPPKGALLINYLSFGVAVLLVYHLARKNGRWTESSALGLALALGFIFLRRLATNASPDIFTYALFLVALFLFYKDGFHFRALSYLIWGMLIPFKLIGVIFIPAAILARYLGKPLRRVWEEKYEILLASASWVLFVFVTLSYSSQSSQPTIATVHVGRFLNYNFSIFKKSSTYFTWSILRTFLSNWYGSIWTTNTLIPFCALLLLGLACLFTLRFHSGRMAKHAMLLILISVMLQFGSQQIDGARLTGYGLITMFLALSPAWRWGKIWLAYGILGVAVSVGNAMTENCIGMNDPRYEKMALDASKIPNLPKKILTNSFHILDVHLKLPTEFVRRAEEIGDAEYFFWVSLPSYDAIATPVSTISMPGEGWREVASVTGAKLFRRSHYCATKGAYEKFESP